MSLSNLEKIGKVARDLVMLVITILIILAFTMGWIVF